MSDPAPSSDASLNPRNLTRRDALKVGAVGVGALMAGAGVRVAAAQEGPGRRRPTLSSPERPWRPGEPPSALERPHLGAGPAAPFAAPPMDVVRIGMVGVGGMGSVHVRNLLNVGGAEIRAICDIRPEHAERSRTWVVEAGQPEPTLYTRGDTDFVRMCEEEELDLVFTATPWRWHVPVCVMAMRNGKHAATEVPAATTVDGCWELVETAEANGRHCVMMENCNYDRMEMMALHMVRRGLLGEVLHAEGGYLHDLRAIKFADEGEGLWRREHSKVRNGNLYPTHGLGPVANCMDINRGDRFETLVSMSSPSRGLQLWAEEHYPEGHPKRRETYRLGDVNTSMIRTVRGRTIVVGHDTNLPRPYSRIHMVQGTRGIIQGYPHRVFLERYTMKDSERLRERGPDEHGHDWEDAEAYLEEWDHPLWKNVGRNARAAGHGGMDYLEDHRLIRCLREGAPTDMTVYDAAALGAVSELSERSVAEGGAPIPFPDFTRGRWRDWPRWDLVEG